MEPAPTRFIFLARALEGEGVERGRAITPAPAVATVLAALERDSTTTLRALHMCCKRDAGEEEWGRGRTCARAVADGRRTLHVS